MATYGQRSDTQSQVDEHITDVNGVSAKKALVLGRDSSNNFQDLLVNPDGSIGGGMVSEVHDYKEFGYTGDDITTITYKVGGAGGTTVATLTLAYTDGNITSITRT